jgi:hypothetical protein
MRYPAIVAIAALQNSGGSKVLGQWTNYVDQDKTNFENRTAVALA